MNEIRLKPCPFCGGEAIQETGERIVWYDETEEFECVHCTRCKCSVEGETAEEAIEKWNTRKPMERITDWLKDIKKYNRVNDIAETYGDGVARGYQKGINEAIQIVEVVGKS